MLRALRGIDWRLLGAVLVLCFLLPALLLGTLIAAILPAAREDSVSLWSLSSVLLALLFLLPPVAAGLVTGRFAASAPLLHAAVAALLGWAILLLPQGASVVVAIAACAAYIALALSAATIGSRLRCHGRNEP